MKCKADRMQYARKDLELCGLKLEWTIFRVMGRDLKWGKHLTLAYHGRNGRFKITVDHITKEAGFD